MQLKVSDVFDRVTEEMYEMGEHTTPLHHKIRNWHEAYKISDIDYAFTEESVRVSSMILTLTTSKKLRRYTMRYGKSWQNVNAS